MASPVHFALIIAAVVLFIVAAVPSEGRTIGFQWLAFACLAASLII